MGWFNDTCQRVKPGVKQGSIAAANRCATQKNLNRWASKSLQAASPSKSFPEFFAG